MGQKKFWQWKDDDSTEAMSRSLRSFFPYGVYYGFDADLTISGMNLNLIHTPTGMDQVDDSLNLVTGIGVALTKQGVIVQEDAPIVLPVNTNPGANPRIDLVVLEDQYQQVIGGTVAVYVVIQGTPGATPAVPALTNANKQVIIGQLYIPGLTTDLSETATVWTKSPLSMFLNDPFIMRTNLAQHSTVSKIFSNVVGDFSTATISGTTLTLNVSKDYNYFTLPSTTFARKDVTTLANDNAGPGHPITIATLQRLKLVGVNNGGDFITPDGGEDVYINVGEPVMLINVSGKVTGYTSGNKWLVIAGGYANKNGINKFHKVVKETKDSTTYDIDSASVPGTIESLQTGNFVPISGAGSTNFKGLLSYSDVDNGNAATSAALEAGTRLLIRNEGSHVLTIQNMATLSMPWKPIATPNGVNYSMAIGGILELVEDLTCFRVVGYIDAASNPFGTYLDDLSDVTLSSVTLGDVLYYNGSVWINTNLEAKITGVEHLMTKSIANGWVSVAGSEYDVVNDWIRLPDTGNLFEIVLPGGVVIQDIKRKNGSGSSVIPSGTIVGIRIAGFSSGSLADFNMFSGNFHPWDDTVMSQANIRCYQGGTIYFYKTSTKWALIACPTNTNSRLRLAEAAITLLESEVTAAGAWRVVGSGGGNPTYANTWAPDGSYPLEFRKDQDGKLNIRGQAFNNTFTASTNDTVFTLPSGYRPLIALFLIINSSSGIIAISIFTSGVVSISGALGSGAVTIAIPEIIISLD